MVGIIYKIHMYLQHVQNRVISFFKAFDFAFELIKSKAFEIPDVKQPLLVLDGFLRRAHYNYPDTLVLNRKPTDSYKLFSMLVKKYISTKSETTLNQILEVLKVDFIKRKSK